MAKATAEHRIMVCRRVWLPSRLALHNIGTVLGPTSGAKGTVPLSTRQPRQGPECQRGALFRSFTVQ